MKRSSFLVLFLILPLVLADFLVTPSSMSWNSNDTPTLTQQFTIVSYNTNESQTVSITAGGDNPSWLSISPSSLVLSPSTPSTFTVTVNPVEQQTPQTYSQYLMISNGSFSFRVNVTGYTKATYPFQTYRWVTKDTELIVDSAGLTYVMLFNSIDTTVDFDVYQGSLKVASESLATGESTLDLDPVVIKVEKLYPQNSKAELLISSDDSDTTVTTKEAGSMTVDPISQTVKISKLDQVTIPIYFINNYDYKVDFDSVRIDPMQDGFDLQYSTPEYIASGDKFLVNFVVDPKQIATGTYTESVKLSGRYRGNSISKTSTITVVIPSGVSQTNINSINVSIPTFTTVGTWTQFAVSGVTESDNVQISPIENMEADPNSRKVIHGVWYCKFKFNKVGAYYIPLTVNGLPLRPRTIYVSSENNLNFVFSPKLKAGTESTISVYDNNTKTEFNATIMVDGVTTNKITPEAGKNYTVCMQLYSINKCDTFSVVKGGLNVYIPSFKPDATIYPSNITVTDENGKILNSTIYLDGRELSKDANAVATLGSHTLKIEAQGYEPIEKSFVVSKPMQTNNQDNTGIILVVIVVIVLIAIAYLVMKGKGGHMPKSKTPLLGGNELFDSESWRTPPQSPIG